MVGNGWKWSEMTGNGWKWLKMVKNGWKWLPLLVSPFVTELWAMIWSKLP